MSKHWYRITTTECPVCGRGDPVKYKAALSIETWLYQREMTREARDDR